MFFLLSLQGKTNGLVAQLGAQLLCKQKVAGSSPVSSTNSEKSRLVLINANVKARQAPWGCSSNWKSICFARRGLWVRIPSPPPVKDGSANHNKTFFGNVFPVLSLSACGGIGRRASLRSWCPKGRVGSSPTTPTIRGVNTDFHGLNYHRRWVAPSDMWLSGKRLVKK